jgi:AcrR family transcriptional regulator
MTTSPPRARNPRGEGARLRDQLVQAAAELIDELGDTSRLSVRAIARRAGVSPTALYLHFADRDALVTATCDEGFAAFNEALLAAASGDSDPLRRLEAMGLAYLAFTERQPALYSVIFSARRPPSASPGVDRKEGFDGLVALLRECDPALGAEEARQRAIAVWAGLHGFATLRAARPKIGWPPAEDFVRRTLAAYVPRRAG